METSDPMIYATMIRLMGKLLTVTVQIPSQVEADSWR